MAAVFAVASSAGVEWMAQRMRLREDSAIAVVWSLGMAVGVLFVFLTPGYVPELNSFLFGNILTINETDIYVFAAFTLVLCTFFAWRFKQIVAVAFTIDEKRRQNTSAVIIGSDITDMSSITPTRRMVSTMQTATNTVIAYDTKRTGSFCTRAKSRSKATATICLNRHAKASWL